MAIALKPGEARGPSRDKDVEVEIVGVKFDPAHVRGAGKPSVAAIITYHTSDGDEYPQNYQAGSPDWFAVTPDGYSLTSAKPQERPDDRLTLSPRSEFSLLLSSLYKCGVPETKVSNSLKNLIGIKGTIRAIVTDTYEPKDRPGTTRDVLTALFTKVDPVSLGAPTSASAPATAPATHANGPAATQVSDEIKQYAEMVLQNVVAPGATFAVGDANKELKAAALKNFVKVKVPPAARKAVIDLMVSPDFVNGLEGFLFDGGAITRV
jgi:hypothetical protein